MCLICFSHRGGRSVEDGSRQTRKGGLRTSLARVRARGQRLRAVILYERRDRIVGSLVLVGKANKLTVDSALPYAKVLDKRIQEGLKPPLVA